MRMIRQLFKDDMKRIFGNLVSLIIVLGLVLLPSIFSWYNVLACWDVFQNTGNLKVAVVNNDEGYQSDLVPLKVNMGEQVSSSLRANAQMDWVFTDEEDAIDGACSGKYYAAVVIPQSFSKDMMTFYTDDVEHASLLYYSNEKKNVVAPKLTDQSADKASNMVNEAFSKTLAEVGLNVASSLIRYADTSDASGQLGVLADHVDTLGSQMSQASNVLRSYSQVLGATQQLVNGSADLLGQAGSSASEVLESADQAKNSVSSITEAMKDANSSLGEAISNAAAGYDGVSDSLDNAFDSTTVVAGDAANDLNNRADDVDSLASRFYTIADKVDELSKLYEEIDPDQAANLNVFVGQLRDTAKAQSDLANNMRSAASNINSSTEDANAKHEEAKELASKAKSSINELSDEYNNSIRPQLDDLSERISGMSGTLASSASDLGSMGNELQGSAGSLSDRIGTAKEKLEATAADLENSSSKFTELGETMRTALSTGDMDQLRAVLYSDPDALASALAAPVQLDRHEVFPAENFGSQMAPLYTTLGLWVGSLLLVVAIKVNVSRKAQIALGYPKLHQLFLGRFGVFAFVSLCQTTVLAVGNMLFLGVQANEPLLYLICFWLAGLVFTFIMYTLVVSFANLGKAIAVFLLIIQVTSGGGSYPLQMLPDFFQTLSPFLPATHVINAMRAAMMGVYNGDFWVEIGCLLLFVVPFLLLGLLLRKPLMRFLNWYVKKAEDSKLVC